jgi:ribosomal protein L11 methyltransferase
MKLWPALDVRHPDYDVGLLLAAIDQFSPSAVEERESGPRVFFASFDARDGAARALAPRFAVAAVDVSDENWAERSQEGLRAVTVGAVTIAPPRDVPTSQGSPPSDSCIPPATVVVLPSMGFGTGHHATTRLCLAALQAKSLRGFTVLDVGTGSGVLAIAARRLGAREVLGIDIDADAIESAVSNLALNSDVDHVRFAVADINSAEPPLVDLVLANLTAAQLVRAAPRLLGRVRPGGVIIVSGIEGHERAALDAAFSAARRIWDAEEEGWVAMAYSVRDPSGGGRWE